MAFKINGFKDLFQLFALITLIEINPTQLQIKIKVGTSSLGTIQNNHNMTSS